MVRLPFILALLFAAISAHAETAPRGMSPVDFIEMPRLSKPALSPDGRTLAYLRSETVWAENEVLNRLDLVDVATGTLLPGPDFSDTDHDASRIWWRPDSQAFVYLKRTGTPEKTQAFLYDLTLEASQQLTQHGESVLDVVWRPDGSGFYFVTAEQQPKGDRQLLSEGWVIPPFESNADREIWSFDMATGETKQIVAGRYSIRQVSLSRNGQQLVFSRVPDHRLDSIHQGEVVAYTADTKTAERWTGNRNSESDPQLSPDGSRMAFIASVNAAGGPYYEPKVFVVDETTPPQRLLARLPMEALRFAWDQTGKGLYILGNTGLVTNLYHYHLETRALTQLTQGEHTVADWQYYPGTDTHIARFETATSPGEIFIMRSREEGFRPVTRVYADWAETYRLPRQEKVTWRGRRGATIEGLLVYPLDYETGQAYPLVTITHGGPRNSSRFGSWHVTRALPVLAAQGYLVLLPNHRGSSGYGDRFVRDMYGTYFRNAHHDVLDGIDALVDRGLADPDRLVKMGWSAGGHMVNKLITQTNRFAAASSGAGVADWRSLHGESDMRFSRQFMFGGEPWDRQPPLRQYNRDSPLNDAWKVQTPTLFFVGENDVRVPPTQSILMYRAVEATGTPTVLFQAEDEPHTFLKPGHQLFKINTELSWFARFALGERYEPVLPEEAYAPIPERAPLDPDAVASSP